MCVCSPTPWSSGLCCQTLESRSMLQIWSGFLGFMGFVNISSAQWEPNISNRRIDPLDSSTRVQSEAAVIEHNDSQTDPPLGGEGVVRNRLRRNERWTNYPHRRQFVQTVGYWRHLEFYKIKQEDACIRHRFIFIYLVWSDTHSQVLMKAVHTIHLPIW